MAQNVKPKGSIILKLLALILAVGLIATILYPKSLWKAEAEKNRRMSKKYVPSSSCRTCIFGRN